MLIECKGTAYASAVDQLLRYSRSMGRTKHRLFLVAFKFRPECIRAAKKARRIELYECGLNFTKILSRKSDGP